MAGAVAVSLGKNKRYNARMTGYVWFLCLIGGSGGLLLGYDNGIIGTQLRQSCSSHTLCRHMQTARYGQPAVNISSRQHPLRSSLPRLMMHGILPRLAPVAHICRSTCPASPASRHYLASAGGVTSMSAFQYKFFRTVYDAKELGAYKVNNPVKAAYCAYNNQVLQLVVSSLYISALFSGIIASKFARLYGRKVRLLFMRLKTCCCAVATSVA